MSFIFVFIKTGFCRPTSVAATVTLLLLLRLNWDGSKIHFLFYLSHSFFRELYLKTKAPKTYHISPNIPFKFTSMIISVWVIDWLTGRLGVCSGSFIFTKGSCEIFNSFQLISCKEFFSSKLKWSLNWYMGMWVSLKSVVGRL